MGEARKVTVRLMDVSVRYPGERRGGLRRRDEDLSALSGVTADFYEGETVGVLGANGAGKSTLMRVIAGLTPVTSGQALAVARPVLLTVGSVLVPSATGRENTLLGALAMGLTRQDARAAVPSILEFAELESAADRPLSTYSAGMTARLKFAVATHRPAAIVLLDEALAVGDSRFRQKCRTRLSEVRDSAATVFLVSHSTSTVNRICTRGLWLDNGAVLMDGDVREVSAAYRASQEIRS